MLATTIIVFREFIEVALIIGIVMASTSLVKNRSYLVLLGLLAGVVGSCVMALFIVRLEEFMGDYGQEYLNIAVILCSMGIICWTILWMDKNGGNGYKGLKNSAATITNENKILLILLVALSVVREGSEIILFLYGVYLAGTSVESLFTGFGLGSVVGSFFGYAIYKGLLILPLKQIFHVTSIVLILLAASMAVQLANLLNQVDVLNDLAITVWDSSPILSESGIIGSGLHVLIGYTEQPTLLQLIFYIATLITISFVRKKSILAR